MTGSVSICLSVSPSVCRMPQPNSRTELPMKPKIGSTEVVTLE